MYTCKYVQTTKTVKREDGQTLTVIRDGALRLRDQCPIRTLESGLEPQEGLNTLTYMGD